MTNSQLIINADDFGDSTKINSAIADCFKYNIINSASLMVNGKAVENALGIVKRENLIPKIGIHIDLTYGKPITSFNFKGFLNDKGNWDRNKVQRMRLSLNKELKKAFYNEINSQVQKSIAYGIRPSHINSHHHIHTYPCFHDLFLEVAKLYNIKLRLAYTYNGYNYVKFLYRKFINDRIKFHHLNYTDFFETIDSYKKRKYEVNSYSVEIIVHPTVDALGVITDNITGGDLVREMKLILT